MHLRITMIVALCMAANLASASVSGLVVEDPWIRAAPPSARALAGYLVIRNDSGVGQVLVGAESEAFASVMLHQTLLEDGVAQMIHRNSIELPSGAKVVFEPGGYHLMLMRPTRPLQAGDQVVIDLLFGDGSRKAVRFTVRASSGKADRHVH